jgi:hypothetical protein
VYHEKIKTTKVYVRDATAVSPYALLLFGGKIKVEHERSALIVDSWITFNAPARVGVLFKELRRRLDALLVRKIETPSLDLGGSDHRVVELICGLLAKTKPASKVENDALTSSRARVLPQQCAGGCAQSVVEALWLDHADGQLYCAKCFIAEYGSVPSTPPEFRMHLEAAAEHADTVKPMIDRTVDHDQSVEKASMSQQCTGGCVSSAGQELWIDPADGQLYCAQCFIAEYGQPPEARADWVQP